jgi:alpha-mannosidase
MEMYPEYIFLQTQPQLYEYMKEDYPEIYEQIKERISEGRWEAGGAMWLEADCNLPSGESLVRQILYGTKFLREEFGVECRYLWLPDVFGYSWALPQILKKSGIDVFMTTKISWNQYNRMPHDTFIWRGIDGTGILTHFITTPDPGGNEGAFYYTYNGGISPFSIRGIWDGYRDKSLNRKLLLAYGFGDGGGGANREMLEMRRRLSELPGLPQVTTGRADRYFEELKKTVESADQYVHTWDGELYLELHRGTYTSQAYNKRMNRKLELLYREAEWLQVMSYVTGKETASFQTSDELTKGWKIILRNQFHDIIPGSSIREVYEDSREEYLQAQHIGEKVCRQELAKLVEQDDRVVTVINSAPWHRHEPVLVKKPAVQGAWLASDDSVCTSQITEDGMLVYVPDVPGMGTTKLSFVSAVDEKKETIHRQEHFIPSQSGIETPFYLVEWNEFGQFTRIFDKEAGREVLADGEAGNVFQVFEDKPKSRHEAWDVDIFYQEKQRTITDCRSLELVEIGPLQAVYRIVWKYMDSVISQDIVFYANSRRIDFRTRVDWHEQRQLLKVAFPVKIRATEATYDIQFGNVKRPTHWNTSWDIARFETVGHQWADLSERDYGVSLLNDCKYGYDIKENRMRLSLIKSALVPDETADQGEHIFTYSLYPHLGDWYSGGTVREAWSLNQPLTLCAGNPLHNIMSLFEFSLANVMVDSVKPAESGEGIILRIHEYAGARGELAIKCGFPFKDWAETNLLEVPLGEPNNGDMKTVIAPYEIKTFLIRLV